MHAGINVKLIRELSGRSQEWTARRLKIGRDRLGRIERGDAMPGLPFARAFCKEFGCTMDAIYRPAADTERILKAAGYMPNNAKAFKDAH